MNHKIARLLLAALFALNCPTPLTARQSSTRVNTDAGNDRVVLSVKVDSMTPVSPYVGVVFGAGTESKENFHRETLIINPSSTFELMVATSPRSFPHLPGGTSQFFTIPKSSGSWSTLNSTTFYMLYPPGASTETVRGYINKEK